MNFHSINFDIIILREYNNEIEKIKEIKNNIFAIKIKKDEIKDTKLLVESIINSGNSDKNRDFKEYPVVINSLYKIVNYR